MYINMHIDLHMYIHIHTFITPLGQVSDSPPDPMINKNHHLDLAEISSSMPKLPAWQHPNTDISSSAEGLCGPSRNKQPG